MTQITANRKYILIAVTAVIIIVAAASAWWFDKYFLSIAAKMEQPLLEQKDGTMQAQGSSAVLPSFSGDTMPVKIFYPSENKLFFKQLSIQNNQLPVKKAETLITEYLKELQGDLKTTKLLGVYKDRENILYIDLSDSFSKNFPGGAEQEYYLLKSLYDTVASNIPGTADIKLLIEGKEIDSIGGHFYSLYPLKEIFEDGQQPPAENKVN